MTNVTLAEIQKMPKVELHRHIDGAVNPKLLYAFAGGRYGGKYKSHKEVADLVRILPDMSVEEIMAQFDSVVCWMQNKPNIESVFFNQVLDLLQENIVYTELRFAPEYHTKGRLSVKEVIETALTGILYGVRYCNSKGRRIDVRLILCIARECSNEMSKRIAQEAINFSERGVVGIDLACNEALYPPELHKEAFAITFNTAIKRTVHAGEFHGNRIKNIKTALTILRADRLGHAIGLTRDTDFLRFCFENKVGIEICPVSNIICGNIPSIKMLELDEFNMEGVLFNINSDDPALFHASLSENLYRTAQAYDWSLKDLKRLMRDAMEMSFVSQEEKLKILAKNF